MNALTAISPTTIRVADLRDGRERDRIDAFVAEHPCAELFHRPQWSLAVERGTGQRSHYLIAEDKRGALIGLLPLSEIRSPLFGNALVSTGFGVGGGIVADDPATVQMLADAAWDMAKDRGCPTVELRGGALPEGEWEAKEDLYVTFVRDLPSGDEAILAAIKKRERAAVRRAQGFGLEIVAGSGKADRDAHYRLYAESVRNLGTPVFPRALFSAMLDTFGEDADILTAFKDGQPLVTVLSFYFKGTAMPFWGGGTRDSRHWRAHEWLHYALMCHAAQRGCTRFDFGRSKVGTGSYSYKKNWGWEPTPLSYATRSEEGAARDLNPLNPRYRLRVELWKKLPLWLANRLGPPIARGLG